MKVLVKRDSATVTPVDVGEGAEAEARIRKLIDEHGASCVTIEDGTPVQPTPSPASVEAKPKRARKPKAA